MSGRVNTINNNNNNKKEEILLTLSILCIGLFIVFLMWQKIAVCGSGKIFLWISNVTEHFSTVNACLPPGKHQAEQSKKIRHLLIM